MKTKLFIMLLGISSLCLFNSCKDEPDELSEGRVTSLVEDWFEERGFDTQYAALQTGYYELNDLESRQKLMKLQAAGLIDYSVERFAWYDKWTETNRIVDHYQSRYFWGYYLGEEPVYKTVTETKYELNEHYFVKVSLTEEGKKEALDSIPEVKPEEDELLEIPDIDYKDFPEENISLTENFKEIPYPGEKKQPTTVKPVSKPEPAKEKETTVDDFPRALDKKAVQGYLNALKKVKTETKFFVAFKIKITDARNIRISDPLGVTCAEADFIMKIKKSTPAGRILRDAYNGIPSEGHVSLEFFQDKGWTIKEEGIKGSLDGIDKAKAKREENKANKEETVESEEDCPPADTCAVDSLVDW